MREGTVPAHKYETELFDHPAFAVKRSGAEVGRKAAEDSEARSKEARQLALREQPHWKAAAVDLGRHGMHGDPIFRSSNKNGSVDHDHLGTGSDYLPEYFEWVLQIL